MKKTKKPIKVWLPKKLRRELRKARPGRDVHEILGEVLAIGLEAVLYPSPWAATMRIWPPPDRDGQSN